MKRAVFLNLLVLLCVVFTADAFGQSDASRRCPFNIDGLWRSDAATEITRMFFRFSPEGHVTLLGYSTDTLPQDFEVITSVGYRLDKPDAPNQIEFTAMRGNDVFPKGVTSWKIVRYGDDNFTTLDSESGRQTNWVREQTHRYFLTFAARSGLLPSGGTTFAMWTVMDGRDTKTEALGVQVTGSEGEKVVRSFGSISAEACNQIIEESEKVDKDSKQGESVMARFELTEAEFETTHQVYQMWDKRLTNHELPKRDPYLNELELLSEATKSLKQCGDRLKINKVSRSESDDVVGKLSPPLQPFEYIRILRKKNQELHVTNSMYPWVWRPLIQQP